MTFDMHPDNSRNTPEVQELAYYDRATTMHPLEIDAEPLDGESNSRECDTSRGGDGLSARVDFPRLPV
jgi:hypothetical protein